MKNLIFSTKAETFFESKIDLKFTAGRFVVKTIQTLEELKEAFQLRFQVFQVEMIGYPNLPGEDSDEFDLLSDHLAIFDSKSNKMIATCRLNCSLFSNKFYSEKEFVCHSLLQRPETKLEIGRVCVQKDFRKGIIILLLWKSIADYMKQTNSRYLFGCGSISTLDSKEAAILYRFLEEEGKIRKTFDIFPTEKYRSVEFEKDLLGISRTLSEDEREMAKSLLPSLCRSYFDIGCHSPGAPAFDRDFKCIDFLTLLDIDELDARVRRKLFGELN